MKGARSASSGQQKTGSVSFQAISHTPRHLSFLRPVYLPATVRHPAGKGSPAILRTMVPKVAASDDSWPAAASKRVCLINRPLVFTSRCCSLSATTSRSSSAVPAATSSQVIGHQGQPKPDFIGAESAAAQPRHLHRQFAFLDPLLGRAALVVEPHHRPAARLQVGHDEPHSGKQFAEVKLHNWPPWSRHSRRIVTPCSM